MQQAIDSNDIHVLQTYFKEHPQRVDITINGLHPVAYAISRYQENTDLVLLKLLIKHSTAPSLLRLDDDGDSIFAFIMYIVDDHHVYSIIKALKKSGYDFNRVYGDNVTDIDFYLTRCIEDNRPMYMPIFHQLATRNVMKKNKDYILYMACRLSLKDMKHIIAKFLLYNIDIVNSNNLMTTIIKKTNENILQKLEYLAELGIKPHPGILIDVCKWNRMNIPILKFLLKHDISMSKQILSSCLFHIITDCPQPDLELVRTLCHLGADPTYKRRDGKDILSLAIIGRNSNLTSVLLPFVSSLRVKKGLKETTDSKTKDTIRTHNILLKYITDSHKGRSKNRLPTNPTIHRQIMSMNDDMFQQLSSYISKKSTR